MSNIVKKRNEFIPDLIREVEEKIVEVRGQKTLLDRDVAELYGVETREVNQAVKNNPRKFLDGYVLELTKEESAALRSKLLTLDALRSNNSTLEPSSGKGRHSKYNFKAFTRKGLYMLATCLKSDRAADATVAIVETFDKVQALKHELLELHTETDKKKQAAKIKHFGEVLTDIVMPDLQTSETESSLEINFLIGKIKHTVKRVRKEEPKK
jgi:phage regulator Rha-like protein